MRRRTFFGLQIAYLVLLCAPPFLVLFRPTMLAGVQLATWLESSFPLARLNAFVLGVYAGVRFRRSMHRRPVAPVGSGKLWRLIPATLAPLILLCVAPPGIYWPLRTGLLQICYAFLIPLLADVRWPILTNHVTLPSECVSLS